jgi:hypothetical protein
MFKEQFSICWMEYLLILDLQLNQLPDMVQEIVKVKQDRANLWELSIFVLCLITLNLLKLDS